MCGVRRTRRERWYSNLMTCVVSAVEMVTERRLRISSRSLADAARAVIDPSELSLLGCLVTCHVSTCELFTARVSQRGVHSERASE